MSPDSVVYVMQADDSGRVKIGVTSNVIRRKAALEAILKCDLHVVLTLPGGYNEEQSLHRVFHSLRDARGIPESATSERTGLKRSARPRNAELAPELRDRRSTALNTARARRRSFGSTASRKGWRWFGGAESGARDRLSRA